MEFRKVSSAMLCDGPGSVPACLGPIIHLCWRNHHLKAFLNRTLCKGYQIRGPHREKDLGLSSQAPYSKTGIMRA